MMVFTVDRPPPLGDSGDTRWSEGVLERRYVVTTAAGAVKIAFTPSTTGVFSVSSGRIAATFGPSGVALITSLVANGGPKSYYKAPARLIIASDMVMLLARLQRAWKLPGAGTLDASAAVAAGDLEIVERLEESEIISLVSPGKPRLFRVAQTQPLTLPPAPDGTLPPGAAPPRKAVAQPSDGSVGWWLLGGGALAVGVAVLASRPKKRRR